MADLNALDLLERIHRDAARLRELAGPALVVSIETAACVSERPAKPPPSTSEPDAAAVLAAFHAIADRASPTKVARHLGFRPGTKGYYRVRDLIAEGVKSGVYVQDGTVRGHPAYRPAGPPPEAPSVPAPAAFAQSQASQNAKVVLEVLEAGPRTVQELVDETGFTRGRVLGVLQRVGHGRARIGNGQREGSSIWERVPLPHEQESVTIRHFNGGVTETRVVECLRRGASSLCELADELGCKPADVSMVVRPLEDAGQVRRLHHVGKYELLEAQAA